MEITNLLRPRSLDEAYAYMTEKKAFLIGGGAWSRMAHRTVETAVDLSALDLRYIRKTGGKIEIGAMATVRDVELSPVLAEAFGPVFRDSVKNIVGVQMRNIVTVGGTVAGRYGFSELNTVLLALGAVIVRHKESELGFEAYMAGEGKPGLVEKIVLDASGAKTGFQAVRNTKADLPILNAAVAFRAGAWSVAVGARPGSARPAKDAAALLGSSPKPDAAAIARAAETAAKEIEFGDDIRGTAEYRRDVCSVLVRRALTEAVR